MKKPRRVRPPQFVLYLDDEDRRLLERASRIEKLTRSEVVRRALRQYYRKLRAAADRIEKLAS